MNSTKIDDLYENFNSIELKAKNIVSFWVGCYTQGKSHPLWVGAGKTRKTWSGLPKKKKKPQNLEKNLV